MSAHTKHVQIIDKVWSFATPSSGTMEWPLLIQTCSPTLGSLESLVVPSDVPQSSRTVEHRTNGPETFGICQGQAVLKKQKEKKAFAAGTNKPRRLDSWLQRLGVFWIGNSTSVDFSRAKLFLEWWRTKREEAFGSIFTPWLMYIRNFMYIAYVYCSNTALYCCGSSLGCMKLKIEADISISDRLSTHSRESAVFPSVLHFHE